LSKKFGEWYQKTNKKEDTNKLTTLTFRIIPILHNTLLVTPKFKFYSGAFANFWGPPNPATKIFMGPHSNFTLGKFVLLGSLPNSNFIPGLLPIWGPTGAFWGSGAQNQILLCGHLFFWEGSQTQILLRGFCPFWGPLGPFGVQGPKIKLYSGAFVLLGRLPNSNFTPGLLLILGPTGGFWGCNSYAQCNPCPPSLGSAWRTCSRSSTVLP
jgi:hypothetical protein